MKKMNGVVLLIILIPLVVTNQNKVPDARGYIVKVGDRIEDFEMKLLDGSVTTLSQLKSKVIVLNFFASWCGVCREEIPHIESEIWQPYQNLGLTVIGVNYKESNEISERARRETGMTYPVVLDRDGKIFEKFARGGVTRNIVLDDKLNIIFLTRLFDQKEFKKMKEVIGEHLKSEPPVSLDKKEENAMEAKILEDLAQSNKKIGLEYTGKYQIHLEGKIFAIKKKKLEIGVALFAEDIVSKKFDRSSRSFKIGYKHYTGVRIAILPMTRMEIPLETETIQIYDIE